MENIGTSWHSYSKSYNLGHSVLGSLFDGPVVIEEKVDGSQFSFGIFNGELKCRSKGQQLIVDAPEKMFNLAVQSVKERAHLLVDGWTYRGEYLQKPKHNSLAYDRTPNGYIMIFDINPAEEKYLSYADKKAEATRIGLETVPLIHEGPVSSFLEFMKFMDSTSILGGQKIEGLVIKNYNQFGPDKKALFGKHVSEAFKEVHKQKWGESNPKSSDILTLIGEQYKTKAKWNKAMIHLAERGELENSPRDIPKVIKEVQKDIVEEYAAEIKEQLWKWAEPHIKRKAIAGLPEYVKEKLAEKQFENKNEI